MTSSVISQFLRANRHLFYGYSDDDSWSNVCKIQKRRNWKTFEPSFTTAWVFKTQNRKLGHSKPMKNIVPKQVRTTLSQSNTFVKEVDNLLHPKSLPTMNDKSRQESSFLMQKSPVQRCHLNEMAAGRSLSIEKDVQPLVSISEFQIRQPIKAIQGIKNLRNHLLKEKNALFDVKSLRKRNQEIHLEGLIRTIYIGDK